VETPVKQPKPRPRSSEAQQKAVRESVRRTLAKIETTRRTKRRKTKDRKEASSVTAAVRVHEGATLRELAETFKLAPQELVKICLDLGVEATINQTLDRDLVELLAEELSVDIQFASDEVESLLEADVPVDPARLEPRAPIVTVMGHVDHGKTSILDYIRETRVASGEAGGITQHIGAYEVETSGSKITFIDTPGHEAFTSMRARGAQVTDIVVLVIAADDGVMPQTIEAINHARAAGVPVILAINKIDLAAADPTRIRQQLTEHDIVVEDFGGEVIVAEVSAKTGAGIDKLLEMILLQAELLEVNADPGASAQAVAVEVRKEEGRGILCTVLVTQGTLRVGDTFVIGAKYGKIRALLDHRGRTVQKAPPAMPVQVLGCNGLPEAGDILTAVRGEREARDIATRRQQMQKDRDHRTTKKVTLEDLYEQIQEGDLKELRLIIKGDTDGSVEALTESLTQLSLDEVGIKVIHAGVGIVGESDVLLASSSQALVVGFNVKISAKAQEVAEREKVEIKNYNVIYEAITEVDDAMKGLLEPERVERTLGKAEVRKVYKISQLGQIAGSMVTEGLIARNAQVRVLREEEVIHEGKISSLKRFQDDVKEVQKDFECGIGISGFNQLQEGDVLEAFIVEEQARVF
jgi:translation initiation factor IF-2